MDTSEEKEGGAKPAAGAKKKRKRRPAEPAAQTPREAGETGDEAGAADAADAVDEASTKRVEAPTFDPDFPAFAHAFPRDPELDALVAAFERGDYARVRREAPLLAERAATTPIARAAKELRRRVDPDPIAVYLLSAAALLLVFLALWYWGHSHELPR